MASVFSSSGSSTVAGVGVSARRGAGAAAGSAAANAVGKSIANSVGAVAGLSEGLAAGSPAYVAAGTSTAAAASTILWGGAGSSAGVGYSAAVAETANEGLASEVDTAVAVHGLSLTETGAATSDASVQTTIHTSTGVASDEIDLLETRKAVAASAGAAAAGAVATLEEMLESTGDASADYATAIVAIEASTGEATSTLIGDRFTRARAASAAAAVAAGVGLGPIVTTGLAAGSTTVTGAGIAALPTAGAAAGLSAAAGAATAVFNAAGGAAGTASASAARRGRQLAIIEDVGAAADLLVFAIPATYPILWNNSQLGAGATWDGLPFNSMVELDGVVYAAGAAGIFQLDDQGDDDGDEVPTEVQWDLTELNGSDYQKRARALYVNAVADAPFTLKIANKQGEFVSQTHLPFATKPTNHRAPVGRGISSRAARVSLLQSRRFAASDASIEVGDTTRRT